MGKNGETPNPGGGNKGGKINIPKAPSPIKPPYNGLEGHITGRD